MLLTVPTRRFLRLVAVCLVACAFAGASLRAETPGFDLTGPSLRVAVTHAGATLPLSQVPNLSPGDRLRIAVELPAQQGARYRMVLAFLRGATNPPPKDWLTDAQTWKAKKATIDAVVPEGAEQALVLLVPDTGGALDAVAAAVRGRPGAFVRASQELNQAMLDRARLDTFLTHVRPLDPAQVAQASPQLAQSLGVKLDAACLAREPQARGACLTQGSNTAVLADSQTSSIAQTLAGTPADIALQLSSTAQAGYGYYSPYIGVVRDLARILGAFQSAQLQFIPALSVQHEATTGLLLNSVPSFRKPQSVLVAALPNVALASPPPLRVSAEAPLCISRPGLVLPVAGAPLVFATDYARQITMRVRTQDGRTTEIPAHADVTKGGYVLATAGVDPARLHAAAEGRLHGFWGFQPFDGPSVRLVVPTGQDWQVAEASSLVVGRESPLTLTGGPTACVADVSVNAGGASRPVDWTLNGARLALKVPLAGIEPGPITLIVRSYGVDQPQRLPLQAYAEASQVSGFTFHAGDVDGILSGTRLDQVASLDLGEITFRPGTLSRAGSTDRLVMTTDTASVGALQAGQIRPAKVRLTDERTVALKVTVAASRPAAMLVSKSIQRTGSPSPVPLTLQGDDVLPQNARLTFSLRAQGATRFAPDNKVEVAATDTLETVSLPVRLQDARIALVEITPATALSPSAHGPLQFRVVQNGVSGDWQPLAVLVRQPKLTAFSCPVGEADCSVSGTDLFLIAQISSGNGLHVTTVPDGFTGSTIKVPHPASGAITFALRDAPQVTARLNVSYLGL